MTTPSENRNLHDRLKRRILIVDDNVDAARTLDRYMKIKGHDVYTVHNGNDAVTTAESFRPDIVLLDIGLPGMSGYEVARRIREQPWGQEMVLIALTGWGQENDRQQSKEAGFNHHLVKPVEMETLLKLLADPTSVPL